MSLPSSAMRVFTAGSASAALTSRLSRSTISARRALGRADAEPAGHRVARDRLGDRRDVRQHPQARRRGHPKRAQRARLDLRHRRADGVEHRMHVAGHQRRHAPPACRDNGTCTTSMPVIIRNSSPQRWVRFPVPLEAMLILPGLALA